MRAFDDVTQLPFASALRPAEEPPWVSEGDYDSLHFDGLTLQDIDIPHSRFLECAITRTAFEGGKMRGTRFGDVWLREVRLVAVEMMETSWQDSAFVSSVLAGVQAYGASVQRVVFSGCKLDSVNLRGAKLTDVQFVDCLLRDVDMAGATIKQATFRGSTLREVELTGATLRKVDLRGAELGLSGGHESLRGAIIDSQQLYDLAPSLADSIGITVRDA